MVVVRAMQSLSRQTTLYVALAHAKAARGLPVSLSRDDAGVRDTQTGLTAGMQYRF